MVTALAIVQNLRFWEPLGQGAGQNRTAQLPRNLATNGSKSRFSGRKTARFRAGLEFCAHSGRKTGTHPSIKSRACLSRKRRLTLKEPVFRPRQAQILP